MRTGRRDCDQAHGESQARRASDVGIETHSGRAGARDSLCAGAWVDSVALAACKSAGKGRADAAPSATHEVEYATWID